MQRIKFFLIYIWMVILAGGLCFGMTGCGKTAPEVPVYDDSVEPSDEISAFCIVTHLDDVNKKIKLQAVNYATEYQLTYTGGTDVRDKYGEILSLSNLELGSVVDIVYDGNRDKLLSLKVCGNDKIQQLQEVTDATLDFDENTICFQNQTYPLAKNVAVFSDNKEIALNEICSVDQLTIWLYNNEVCSIYVELGHGYLRLMDHESYIGGTIEIGYDLIVPVTEEMLLTVREGDYTLRISKDNDSGTKEVTVVKNQEQELSLADIAIEPKQVGSVLFDVTPSDASVYIDGKRVNTEGAVEIVYGKHRIDITAQGYQSYSAAFNVNYAYKVKKYTLELADGSETTTESNASTTATTKNTTRPTTERTDREEKTTQETSKDGVETKNKVTVSKPIGANVYLDGEYLGVAPISFTKVTGSHIITLSMSGYLSKSYTETFTNDGSDKTLEYEALKSIASLIE